MALRLAAGAAIVLGILAVAFSPAPESAIITGGLFALLAILLGAASQACDAIVAATRALQSIERQHAAIGRRQIALLEQLTQRETTPPGQA
jgi:hypothetical protein